MKIALLFVILVVIVLTECKLEPRCAPYIDTSSTSTMSMLPQLRSLGLNAITFAFVLSHGSCTPMWNGVLSITDSSIIGPINQWTASGGDCIVSFGGAVAPYLENSCTTASSLASAYQSALVATGCNHIDLDMEASLNSIDMVNQALKILQTQTGCTVSFTLAADENGLNSFGIQVLNSAVAQGVNVDIVNPMCMDFPRGPDGTLDAGVITCANAVYNNMVSIWGSGVSYSMLGVTTMIGTQDTGGTFTLNGMNNLVAWAQQNGIGHLAFWSLNRDNGGCAGGGAASSSCSGVSQNTWDYTRAILPFCGSSSSTVTPPTTSAPTTTGTTPPTTTPSSGGSGGTVSCNSGNNGKFYPDPTKCPSPTFYECNNGNAVQMSCGGGTYFNPTISNCDYSSNIKCPYQG